MESLPDVAQFARNFSVLVRSQGPDPKGLKMRNHAFHLHQTGSTTLSASGILLPDGCLSDRPPIFDHVCGIHRHSGDLVVTPASVVEPFLTAEYRNKTAQEFSPKLIPAARIDVLIEGKEEGTSSNGAATIPRWSNCKLMALVDVTASSVALLSLLGGDSGLQESSSWEVGWSLAAREGDTQAGVNVTKYSSDSLITLSQMIESATRIAILGIPKVELKNMLHVDISEVQQRGDLLIVMGSPFGILSPSHFLNSISSGVVANCCSAGSVKNSLLLADIRCLPGMEGGPVFDRHACLVGMLTSPLRQKSSNAEIQLVITWNVIATAWGNGLQNEPQNVQQEVAGRYINKERRVLLNLANSRGPIRCLPEGSDFPNLVPSLRKAMSSVALVTVGDGTWASGIVLNPKGLILTNAHLLEPWRFGRKSLVNLVKKSTRFSVECSVSFSEQEEKISEDKRQRFFLSASGSSSAYGDIAHDASLLNRSHKNYRKISVRLDNMECQFWCDASVVYVSNGPIDVALLQLDHVPCQLCPINPEFHCPSIGLPVHVIGHGLLGPRSGIWPSVSTGIVSHVVRVPEPLHIEKSGVVETEKRSVPVMLQTTAAVHPGASGGAVVDSDGHMIGLITSNAKHGGGRTIPHLNFSIPCAALLPIFRFSDEHDWSMLKVLDEPNDLLSSVWALAPPPSQSKQSISEKNDQEGKGSRFSKFLAKKHSGLEDLTHVIKEKLPSKL
ncbi:unnamed protein product [Musa acuminata subsp. malaccensis]|uniref:(wild Malaysian banana) hypothetical protein n=1 Tax=Musa acuminata subsp. malaccensis TaxID=214687 RepID=A0A8D7B672_MUSAM|nr:unnamed protein product [Musa acuminata subsp. malaccensis]